MAGTAHKARRIAKWTGIVLAVLLALLVAAYSWIESDSGRRFVISQIEGLELENGMKIGIGELDGSLFGALTIRGLTLSDPQGVFLQVPEAELDWRPLAYLSNHVDVRSLTAQDARLLRLPQFREVPPSDDPLLPDLDIDIGTFLIERFVAEAEVSGEQRILTLAGDAHIADGRALVNFSGETLGDRNGDRLLLALDAVPEEDLLDIDLSLFAPQTGVIAALVGLDAPLQVNLAGKGDWARWDGELDGALGGQDIADLQIAARDGRFTVKGEGRFAQLTQGLFARSLGPVTTIDLAATFEERRMDLDGAIASDGLRLDGNGIVDLGANRFDGLELSVAVLAPTLLGEDLSTDGFNGNFTLNGAFAEPVVDYAVTASRIAIADIGLERFRARGTARVDRDGYLVPVEASAERLTGLDSVAGGTLANVSLGGNLAVHGTRILSDDLRVRTSRVDARATLIADFSTGTYAGAFNGTISDYRFESVGIFAVESDLDLSTGGTAGFALEGRVRARSTRLFSEGVANFLGGHAVGASDIRYGTDGVLRLSNMALEAPLVRLRGGSGEIGPEGRIVLSLDAETVRYGELGFELAGTISEPRATLTAPQPDLGIGLAGVTADISGAEGIYRLSGQGHTDYGPLTAEITMDTRDRLAIEVDKADLGGIRFAGSLRQTPQGPFAGRLRADGRGLGGVVELGAQGEYQQADFNLRARNTQLEGAVGLSLGSAIVDGRLVLYEQPEVVFDAQVSQARLGTMRFAAARAQVEYREGKGEAKFLVEGSRAFPFRLAANARLEPDLWRATLAGKIRGIDIATRGPARIVPQDGTYELLPTRLTIGSGTLSLAGTYGEGMKLQSRLEDLNIGLVNAFVPALGVGGTASGSVDFAQADPAAFPRADARLEIDGFTRTTAVSVSRPVDVNFAGKLLADGGEGSAVFRDGGEVIGRMKVSLRPLAPGAGDWVARLMGAPLSGGVRYNGPAGTLFSLAGQSDQRLSGPLGIAADFSGRVRDPRLDGIITAKGLVYEHRTYGTRLTDLAVDGRLRGDRIEFDRLTASAGEGSVEAKGFVSLAADRGFPMDIDIALDNARLARSESLAANATGDLRLTKQAGESALLSGAITLPETRYKFVREAAVEVPRLSGVRFKPREGPERFSGEEAAEALPALFDNVRLDISLNSPGRLYVSGMGLESEWRADLSVSGTNSEPRLSGAVQLVRGTLGFAGRSFELQEGRIQFTGSRAIDPRIAIVAQEDVEEITVNVSVSGRALDPQVAFSSVPGLPQDEIVSRILFGSSVANLSAIQAVQLAASLNSLRATGGGLNPLGSLRSATGVDRLRILGADEVNGRGTALAAGKYLTDDIYIEIITDARGFTATQLEVSLTPALSILSQAGGSGTSDVSLQYKKNY